MHMHDYVCTVRMTGQKELPSHLSSSLSALFLHTWMEGIYSPIQYICLYLRMCV